MLFCYLEASVVLFVGEYRDCLSFKIIRKKPIAMLLTFLLINIPMSLFNGLVARVSLFP